MEIGHGAQADADERDRVGPWRRIGPPLTVLAVVTWNAVHLRTVLTAAAYFNDSAMHEQMVRFASARIGAGHLPLTSWFPYLDLGSPLYLHYQALPSMTVGLLGTVADPDTVFRSSLFVLWSAWPVAVYCSARILGLGRWTAAAASVVSPLLMSVVGIGYEPTAYLFTGWGVWTQLWGSWALPIAWACSWRALEDRRFVLPASLSIALTASFHFETTYLALAPLPLLVLSVPAGLPRRVANGALVVAGAAALAAWVVVPVVAEGRWAATNEVLAGTTWANGYGAGRVLSWLFTGGLFDAGRLPVVSVLAAVGLARAIVSWRRDLRLRAITVLFVVTLVLSFGRTTLGPLVDVIPGHGDIFMRRFMMGPQLAGILLAGVGAATIGRAVDRLVRERLPEPAILVGAPVQRAVRPVVAGAALVAVLLPATTQVAALYARNAAAVADQHDGAQAAQQRDLSALVALTHRHGGGRVYAGSLSGWGDAFTVAGVPVTEYLESEDVDEVGDTLRTASLMSDAEYHFDDQSLGDYELFGVRWLLLPTATRPPVPAHLVSVRGPYSLWSLPGVGYVRVAETVGSVAEDRGDIGARSVGLLRSGQPGADRYLSVAYDGAAAAPPTDPGGHAGVDPGSVLSTDARLDEGTVSATVDARRRAVVVLSASYDPGWRAWVDGRPEAAQMVAPALVAVTVSPGRHRVVFRYVGFGSYPELLGVALVALVLLVALFLRSRRPRMAA